MSLWLLLTILTAMAAAIVAAPFLRRSTGAGESASSLDVYKDQLTEVERDKEQGVIEEAEADLARVEIERRILQAARDEDPASTAEPAKWRYQTVTGVAMIVVLGSVGLYAAIGQPSVFFAQQQTQNAGTGQASAQSAAGNAAQTASNKGGVETMVKRLEERLKDDPDNPDGWRVLGWSYYNTGRYQEAVKAYKRAVDLQKDNPTIRALYGEALVKAANGVVTDEALSAFDKVLAANPNDERGRFFKGLAREQKDDNQGAIDEWMALYKAAPAGAEWTGDLRVRIEQLAEKSGIDVKQRFAEIKPSATSADPSAGSPPHAAAAQPGPTAKDIENAKQMSSEDQQAMVRGMVDGLARRLAASPKDVNGWIMLIRSHITLNEPDKAQAALERANKAFAAEPETQKRIAEAAQGMGVSLSKEQ